MADGDTRARSFRYVHTASRLAAVLCPGKKWQITIRPLPVSNGNDLPRHITQSWEDVGSDKPRVPSSYTTSPWTHGKRAFISSLADKPAHKHGGLSRAAGSRMWQRVRVQVIALHRCYLTNLSGRLAGLCKAHCLSRAWYTRLQITQ